MYLKQIATYFACIIIALGCNRNQYPVSRFDIPSKKLAIREAGYISRYGFLRTHIDTVITTKHLYREYSKGVLTKIGRLQNQKPTGYWFLFKGSTDNDYILRYSANSVDTFEHPFAIINPTIRF